MSAVEVETSDEPKTYLVETSTIRKRNLLNREEMPEDDDVDGIARATGSNLAGTVEDERWGEDIISPRYDPERLYEIAEQSSTLPPCIEAYVTNCDGMGHEFKPSIDLKSKDVDEKIRTAILVERVHDAEKVTVELLNITPGDIKAKRLEIEAVSHLEKMQLELLFDRPMGLSFIQWRKRMRRDVETTGTCYSEVVRDRAGGICQLNHAPSTTMRMLRLDKPHPVEIPRKISSLSYRMVPQRVRMRRYVQLIDGQERCYFKSLGDPRIISAKSGTVYKSTEAMRKREGRDTREATEMVHFSLWSGASPYGLPRWLGAAPVVLGTRASEEINYMYFDNKTMPPFVVTVSGGSLAKESRARLDAFMRANKGRKNFHAVLVLEAEATKQNPGVTGNPRVVVDIKPLTHAQQTDGLFQQYEERGADKVGAMFRLPRLIRGDVRDFNRATADASLRFAESQVFAPERADFDYWVNQTLLAHMGIRFWEFASKGPIQADAQEQINALSAIAGAMLPNELRTMGARLTGEDLPEIDAEWTREPLAIYAARVAAGATAANSGATSPAIKDNGLADLYDRVVAIRDSLRDGASVSALKALEAARGDDAVMIEDWTREAA